MKNYEQWKNTANSGKLIKAVYTSHVYVCIFCTSFSSRLVYNSLFVGQGVLGCKGQWAKKSVRRWREWARCLESCAGGKWEYVLYNMLVHLMNRNISLNKWRSSEKWRPFETYQSNLRQSGTKGFDSRDLPVPPFSTLYLYYQLRERKEKLCCRVHLYFIICHVLHYRHSPIYTVSYYEFQTYKCLKRKNVENNILSRAPIFFLRVWKLNETKVAEE